MHVPEVAPRECRARVGVEAGEPGGERVGQQAIVGVEKDEVLAARVPQTGVAGRRETLVLLADVAHVGIAGGDGGRLVGRAVVDDDRLDAAVRLAAHAVDRLAEKVAVVEARNDDRHERRVCRRTGAHRRVPRRRRMRGGARTAGVLRHIGRGRNVELAQRHVTTPHPSRTRSRRRRRSL